MKPSSASLARIRNGRETGHRWAFKMLTILTNGIAEAGEHDIRLRLGVGMRPVRIAAGPRNDYKPRPSGNMQRARIRRLLTGGVRIEIRNTPTTIVKARWKSAPLFT